VAAVTRRQRNELVEGRADLILVGALSVQEYASYFEVQMHCSKVRKLIYSAYAYFARAGAAVFVLQHGAYGDPLWP